MKNVKQISYPNTVIQSKRAFSEVGGDCDEIKQIMKAGEMAGINWFQIIKDNKVIAEIKESVCDIYGEDKVEGVSDCPF